MNPFLRHRLGRISVVAAALLLVAPGAFPEVAQASVGDAQREVERIVDTLDRLSEQADILAEDWAEAEDNLRQLEIDVVAAAEKVALKEAELGKLRGDLSEVAIRAFTGNGADVLGPLFSDADQYGQGLRRDQYSRVALSVGTTTTDDLDEFISELDADRKDLENKKAQVEVLKATIEDKQQQTLDLTAQYEAQRSQAEARYAEAIAAEEQRRAEAAYARLQAELAAAQQAAASQAARPTGNAGGGNAGGGTTSGGDTGGNTGGGGGAVAPATPAPTPAPTVNIPAVSGLAGVAIQAAQGQLGVPYRYATSNPGVSFDCSGLTHYAWGRAGVYLPRNSRAQAAATVSVPAASAQPGDLIFYYSPISHVGIYIGGGQLIHAPNSGTVVKVSSVSWGKVTKVTRPG
jgi:cell wall-associated NlpC family hydrolase